MLVQHVGPRDGVLDLGAGTGALLSRIQSAGFGDLTAVDLKVNQFMLKDVPIRPIDLNTQFSQAFDRKFWLVTAVEVIEHTDSPLNFLRNIRALLADDGFVCVSTPNIAHWQGRLRFLAQGTLRLFKDYDYREQRHISPVTDNHMRMMLAETGFDLIAHKGCGSFEGPLKRIVLAPATAAFRAMCGPLATGDVNIYVARVARPKRT
jgi:2-polyprenyl-3-methyl-5-hydroxy-6-metoxy-1,4-benzoquinol methylase